MWKTLMDMKRRSWPNAPKLIVSTCVPLRTSLEAALDICLEGNAAKAEKLTKERGINGQQQLQDCSLVKT